MASKKPPVAIRRPPKPAHAPDPDAFVSGGKRSSAQTSKRSTVKRADGRELRRMTIYLTPELAKRLAVHCAETGEDMSAFVATAVDKAL